jgi:putative sugar O-methyltransferase
MNIVRQYYRSILDFFLRLRNYVRRRIFHVGIFTINSEDSDSSSTFYGRAVERIISSDRKFRRFRRIYDYREILEHVSLKQAHKYIERVNQLDPSVLKNYKNFINNDFVGMPYRYSIPNIGLFSPTTIRYIAVLVELRKIFGENFGGHIVEIGVGYGGQYLVMEQTQKIQSYSMYDLPSVQNLTEKYLKQKTTTNKVVMRNFQDETNICFDLVISNYAFSELPKPIQVEYVEKVLSKAKKGYMIMNSGRTNDTGRSTGKLSLDELKVLLPPFEILEEIPNSSPDNYVIAWGHN